MTQFLAARVLIVDDDPGVGGLIRQELACEGLDCHLVEAAGEARAFIDNHPPDVMIADVELTQSSGLELLAYARGRAPRCRVILVTGHSRRQYLAQALLLGAFDYLEKPFESGQLVEVVTHALRSGPQTPILIDRAATAMEVRSQSRQAALDSVTALVRAVEAKDPYTRRHSEQVAHYAVHIGLAMGLPKGALQSVRIASLLHDIGKIGVPDQILTKPGPLTEEEFGHIRRHPALGSDILASVTLFTAEAALVRSHHERWDGKGYPDGLAGEQSPRSARLIQVADCIDAMLMERTYKKGYGVEKMLGELGAGTGTQFDPAIAAAAAQWCAARRDLLILPGRRNIMSDCALGETLQFPGPDAQQRLATAG